MDKLLVLLILLFTIMLFTQTISAINSTPYVDTLGLPNRNAFDLENVNARWCPLSNTVFTAGGENETTNITEWSYNSAPLNRVAQLCNYTDGADGSGMGMAYNWYEQNLYFYGGMNRRNITWIEPLTHNVYNLTELIPQETTSVVEWKRNIGATYCPLTNSTYLFGGLVQQSGGEWHPTANISIHTLHNNSVYNISTKLPEPLWGYNYQGQYSPDYNSVTFFGGKLIATPYPNYIGSFSFNNDSYWKSSNTFASQMCDSAVFYNTYDNKYYMGGGVQPPGTYYKDIYSFDPQHDTLIKTAVTIQAETDDMAAVFNMSMLSGFFIWDVDNYGNGNDHQYYITRLSLNNSAFTIPQFESIYNNRTLANLTDYMNYQWGNLTATEYPRYNNSVVYDSTPIVEWYKVTTNGEYDGTSVPNYNLSIADDIDFTENLTTYNTSDYPLLTSEFESLVRFQVPEILNNGTKFIRVNNSYGNDSDIFTFEGAWENIKTEEIRVTGSIPIPNTRATTDSVFAIVSVLIVISAILLILAIVKKYEVK